MEHIYEELEVVMKLAKLKLEKNDVLIVKYDDNDLDPIDANGESITAIEFQDHMIEQFKDIYPDLLVTIAMNLDIEKISEEGMNNLGWYRKD